MWPPLNGTQHPHGIHVGGRDSPPPRATCLQHIFIPTVMATFDTVFSVPQCATLGGVWLVRTELPRVPGTLAPACPTEATEFELAKSLNQGWHPCDGCTPSDLSRKRRHIPATEMWQSQAQWPPKCPIGGSWHNCRVSAPWTRSHGSPPNWCSPASVPDPCAQVRSMSSAEQCA